MLNGFSVSGGNYSIVFYIIMNISGLLYTPFAMGLIVKAYLELYDFTFENENEDVNVYGDRI